MKSKFLAMAFGTGLALASLSANASWSWTVNGAPTGPSGTVLPAAASVTAYSDTGASGALVASSDLSNPQRPVLNWYSGYGYGVCSPGENCSTAPEHAMDNNGYKESVLLSFGSSSVNLSQLTFGWTGTSNYGRDSDISVLAYTGTGTPITSTSTYGSLIGKGWQLIGNYANVQSNAAVSLGTSVTASYWLVAAYNSVFAGNNSCETVKGAATTCGMGNDYVKLYSVAGNTVDQPPPPGKVPEPSGMLLFGAAIAALGIVARLRRGEGTSA